jgi:hypothetical protein
MQNKTDKGLITHKVWWLTVICYLFGLQSSFLMGLKIAA